MQLNGDYFNEYSARIGACSFSDRKIPWNAITESIYTYKLPKPTRKKKHEKQRKQPMENTIHSGSWGGKQRIQIYFKTIYYALSELVMRIGMRDSNWLYFLFSLFFEFFMCNMQFLRGNEKEREREIKNRNCLKKARAIPNGIDIR